MNPGWRTVVVQGSTKLSTREGQLILTDIKENLERAMSFEL